MGFSILIIGFITALIIVNIRKKKESQTSILMRIMANYLQVMTATLAYSMKFPEILTDMFFPVEKIGSSSESLFSFDCFAKDTQITLFAPSGAIFKSFIAAISPLILFLGIVLVFSVLHLLFPKYFTDFKRNVVVSTITILFLLHPTLTSTSLGMFQCIQIDEGVSKVRIDLSMDCYSLEHISWCMFIAVPMLIIWVFGSPLLAFMALYKNRHRLNDTAFQRYFIVLYQGLKEHKFYWEVVNTVRKVLVVSINVFMAQFPLFYKGATAIVLLLVFIRVQMKLDPFKLYANNEWELISFTASALTLFGGLLYVAEDTERVAFIDLIAFLIILAINLYFIFLWAYLMSYTMHKFKYARKFTNFMQIILLRKKDTNNQELLGPTVASFKKSDKSDPKKKKNRKIRKNPPKNHFKNDPKNKMLILDNSEKPATPKRQIVGKKGRAARQKDKNGGKEDKNMKMYQLKKSISGVPNKPFISPDKRKPSQPDQRESLRYTDKEEDKKPNVKSQRHKTLLKDYYEARKALFEDPSKRENKEMLIIVEEDESFFNMNSEKDISSLDHFRIETKKSSRKEEIRKKKKRGRKKRNDR